MQAERQAERETVIGEATPILLEREIQVEK